MASVPVGSKSAALTDDGGADGWVKIADNDGWLPGALVTIRDADTTARECRIAAVRGTTDIRLRFTDNPAQYGFSDMSGFTVAQSARLSMDPQAVAVRSVFTPRDRA